MLDLRRRSFTGDCGVVEGLPLGWKGSLEMAGGPVSWRRVSRGPAVALAETVPLVWEIFHSGGGAAGMSPEVERHGLFQRHSRLGALPRGDFQGVNCLGVVEFVVRFGTDRQGIFFEVVSTKFGHERDFERMTADIAAKCGQLLLQWNTPSGVPFTSDPERRRRLLLEQFLYLSEALGGGRLERWMEAVRNNPHSTLSREANWRPAGTAWSSDFLRNPLAMARGWRGNGGRRLLPGEVLDVRKREDRDTAPNRFLLHALESFDAVCREVVRLFQPNGGPAATAAQELSSRISALLGGAFLRAVSSPQRIALENQTLQKREGYRDLLRVWLQLDQASRLDWEGREDVFNATVRDVATLYEYWLFFELLEVLKSVPQMREIRWPTEGESILPVFCQREGRLTINLRRGRASMLVLEQSAPDTEALRIHFCFDRSYSPTKPGEVLSTGAYSRPFRPDFSLVIFPASFAAGCGPLEAEAKAERDGKVAYLHFDAKYRVDQTLEIFGPDDESVLSEEEGAKSTNTYKRADLYKMHAYNDAIRRTVGSYVLYPGNGRGDARYAKYHEILPGVGAFSISPGHEDGRREIQGFVADVLERQRDRFTQLARINYWTHDTVREEPIEYHAGGFASHVKPPKDASVVLGFLPESENPKEYEARKVFFCHAVEWSKEKGSIGERRPGSATKLGFNPLRADWMGVFVNKVTAPWLAKVENVRIVSAEERVVEMNPGMVALPESERQESERAKLEKMGAAYYYRFQLGEFHGEPARNVETLVPRRPGKPIGCTLAELANCQPVSAEEAS